MEKYENILKGYLNLDSSKISFEIFTKMVGGIYENIPSGVDLRKFLVRKITLESAPVFLSSIKNMVDWDKERINYCYNAFDITKNKVLNFAVFKNEVPFSLLRLERRILNPDRGELFLGGIKRKSPEHTLSALLFGAYILFNQDKFGMSSIITRREESDLKDKFVLDFSNLESERSNFGNVFELIQKLHPAL